MQVIFPFCHPFKHLAFWRCFNFKEKQERKGLFQNRVTHKVQGYKIRSPPNLQKVTSEMLPNYHFIMRESRQKQTHGEKAYWLFLIYQIGSRERLSRESSLRYVTLGQSSHGVPAVGENIIYLYHHELLKKNTQDIKLMNKIK